MNEIQNINELFDFSLILGGLNPQILEMEPGKIFISSIRSVTKTCLEKVEQVYLLRHKHSMQMLSRI